MESPPVSREALISAYVSALPLVEVAIVGAGKRCRITAGEIPKGEPVAARYYFRASHAELLLATIGQDGLSGKSAAALAEAIVQTAAMLGARYQSPAELHKFAEQAVDEIVARIKLASQDGKLKHWNRRFKQYRLAQGAKGEKAIGYWQYLEQVVTLPTVRSIAAGAG